MRHFLRLAGLPLAVACAGLVSLRAAEAPAAETDPAALARELADARDQLSTALRSFSLLQDENRQLKEETGAGAAKLAEAQAEIAALKAQVPLAAQADKLRTQVHQLQDQCAALAEEVLRLKTRLALAAPLPGAAAPSRSQR